MSQDSAEHKSGLARLRSGLTIHRLGFIFSLALGTVVVCGAVLALLLLSETSADQPVRSRLSEPLRVETISAISQAEYTVLRRYTALIEAAKASDVGFEVSGRITDIYVDIGDQAKRGDIIARIDTRRLHGTLTELRSQLEDARATATQRRLELQRQESLASRDATSGRQLEEARANSESADAQVGRIEAQIRIAEVDLDDAALSAPFDGVVTGRYVSVGDMAQSQSAVVRLVQSSSREAHAALPISAANALTVGDRVRLNWNAQDYEATVKSVVPEISPGARSATVVIALPGKVTPAIGETLTVLVEQTVPGKGHWVPVVSLVSDLKGLFAVQAVVRRDGRSTIQRAPVEILYTDGVRAFVSGTLSDDAEVVVSGTHRVLPGQVVTATRISMTALKLAQ